MINLNRQHLNSYKCWWIYRRAHSKCDEHEEEQDRKQLKVKWCGGGWWWWLSWGDGWWGWGWRWWWGEKKHVILLSWLFLPPWVLENKQIASALAIDPLWLGQKLKEFAQSLSIFLYQLRLRVLRDQLHNTCSMFDVHATFRDFRGFMEQTINYRFPNFWTIEKRKKENP